MDVLLKLFSASPEPGGLAPALGSTSGNKVRAMCLGANFRVAGKTERALETRPRNHLYQIQLPHLLPDVGQRQPPPNRGTPRKAL